MNRDMIEEHLALADCHVAEGEARIRRQREIHSEMVRDGHKEAATTAITILRELEELQATFIAERDRLANELSRMP